MTVLGIGSRFAAQLPPLQEQSEEVIAPDAECWSCLNPFGEYDCVQVPPSGDDNSITSSSNTVCYGTQAACENMTECGGTQEVTPVCGNGVLDQGEMCDGNISCPFGQFCEECQCIDAGDNGAEAPDPPPVNNCGNGTLDPGEECDGVANCRQNCTCDSDADVVPLPSQNKCVECVTNADCSDNTGKVCNAQNQCVHCLSDNDCSGDTPYCSNEKCVQCTDDAQCTGYGSHCLENLNECGCNPKLIDSEMFCCEDIDGDRDGRIDDPEDWPLSQPPGGTCGENICVWCLENTDGSCTGMVETTCANCRDPNTDSDPDNDDPDWKADPGCFCESPDMDECDAYYCNQPYAGDCLTPCSSPSETNCFVEVGDPKKRVVRGPYHADTQCFMSIDTDDEFPANDDEGICKIPSSGTYGGSGGGGTLGGGVQGGVGGVAISAGSPPSSTGQQGSSGSEGGQGGEQGGSASDAGGGEGGKDGGSGGGDQGENGGGQSRSMQSNSFVDSETSDESAASIGSGESSASGIAQSSGASQSDASDTSGASSFSLALSFSSNEIAASSTDAASSVEKQSSEPAKPSAPDTPYCGDGILQEELGEECDFGSANVPPGTQHHPLLDVCSCPMGENCRPPKDRALWTGCRWPKCGDGIVNNDLQFATGDRSNFDLQTEECDDGNMKDGDGCSAVCKVESSQEESQSSSVSDAFALSISSLSSASSASSVTSTMIALRSSALSIMLITSSQSFDSDDDGSGDDDDGIAGNQDDDDDGDGDNDDGTAGNNDDDDDGNGDNDDGVSNNDDDDDGSGDDDDGIAGNQDDDDDGDGDNDDGTAGNNDDDDDGDGDNDDGILGNQDDDDNGNGDNDDGSAGNQTTLVASASLCGNRILETGEECDDGNARDNDGCNSRCLLEIGICGDGIVQRLLGEQCEQVSHDPALPYGCLRCLFASQSCGDGVLDAGEECDNGPLNSTSPDADCRPDCHTYRCGDGILDSSEICDDGNRLSGDGCDRFCKRESTLVAGDRQQVDFTATALGDITTQYQPAAQQFGFPQFPTMQQLPYQLPLAQLQPLIQNQGPIGDTGPAAVAVIGAGAAAGFGWVKRKRR